ncbi:MAG: TM2 domain-containing protein [Coriobacteriales bacterium]|nr:TM2 domain-containing protein [Coriobacteriales bacterium]
MAEVRYVCPNCGGRDFDKNPHFLECCDCGVRYVARPDGSLQRTTIYGTGTGSRARQQESWNPVQNPQVYATNGGVINNYYNVNVEQNVGMPYASRKQRWIALILCIFFGMFGVHYFYLGRPAMGILFLITVGFAGFGWVIDIIRILLKGIKDGNGIMVI